jgi:hypothetical protein
MKEFIMKIEWQKLTYSEQTVYLDKAKYLLERGYIVDKTVVEVAKQIYESN